METRTIGRSDLRVSRAGLGCDNLGDPLDREASIATVRAALDLGVTFFDTADCYGDGRSETWLGEAVAGRRDEVVLATKFGSSVDGAPAGASPAYVRRALEQSLRRLGTDRVDLYQLHETDPAVPLEDTLGALDDLRREGKIRVIGASNLGGDELRRADGLGPVRFEAVQFMWNLLERDAEADIVPACAERAVSALPWFPLAGGLLTGKYRAAAPFPAGSRYDRMRERIGFLASEERLRDLEILLAMADHLGRPLGDVALAWLAAQPTVVSVIAGATTPEQVRQNTRAASIDLGAEERAVVATTLRDIAGSRA